MRIDLFAFVILWFWFCACSCQSSPVPLNTIAGKSVTLNNEKIVCGAERMEVLLPLLKGKRVALLVNQTSVVNQTHLVDTLLAQDINIKRIFAPEHGFRGGADAGEHVADGTDKRTGIPVVSLYGSKKKPSVEDLKDVDVVLFDIQDVGARFYTFISSLQYLMEACAETDKLLVVLDRPNPNGWYVDGPVLKREFQSFVGLAPIPVVHGLTVGEYAQMVNGEKWLPNGMRCNLTVVKCLNYDHTKRYSLPVKPSPNLPNDVAIYLYPSICFFEGTDVSVARGTDFPFQAIGSPNSLLKDFSFTPESKPGAKSPPHLGKVCYGLDLRTTDMQKEGIQLSYLIKMLANHKDKATFFLANNFFDKLAGNAELRKQLLADMSEEQIKATWQKDLQAYKEMRKKHLLYPDF
ncbi:MAG: DUF1343 domain-containing protein [Chitinophagales bacterium]|nr:DUF1343 domain-containing protein [Chitinophagales bacterium]